MSLGKVRSPALTLAQDRLWLELVGDLDAEVVAQNVSNRLKLVLKKVHKTRQLILSLQEILLAEWDLKQLYQDHLEETNPSIFCSGTSLTVEQLN